MKKSICNIVIALTFIFKDTAKNTLSDAAEFVRVLRCRGYAGYPDRTLA